jgi:flagellar basal body rod protein FlgC
MTEDEPSFTFAVRPVAKAEGFVLYPKINIQDEAMDDAEDVMTLTLEEAPV